MMVFIDSWLPWLGDLLSLGGNILALILVMAFVLWTLLCERLYFLWVVYPQHVKAAIRLWDEREDKSSWFALQYRDHLRHRIAAELNKNYSMIGTHKTYRYSLADPLFPFGFGLSYTTFRYAHLQLSSTATPSQASAPERSRG